MIFNHDGRNWRKGGGGQQRYEEDNNKRERGRLSDWEHRWVFGEKGWWEVNREPRKKGVKGGRKEKQQGFSVN